ncbi:MAG: hypothetical protein ACI4AA_00265 [Lachnospiraceae bacterium]
MEYKIQMEKLSDKRIKDYEEEQAAVLLRQRKPDDYIEAELYLRNMIIIFIWCGESRMIRKKQLA